MSDERFWELVDDYENGKKTVNEVIEDICRETKNYNIATADFALVVKREVTKAEKMKFKLLLDGKNKNEKINN